MTKTLFITGTGTGVGKTVVTAAILRYLRREGVDAVPMKPVQTGAKEVYGKLHPEDLEFHCRAAGLEPDETSRALMAPYLYEQASSPHLAARLADRPVEVDHIVDCVEKLHALHDVVIVEGAGGVMVPLNDDALMLDLMKALNAPVILAAVIDLGTINHCLLSIQVMRDAGLEVLGVIFNEPVQVKRDAVIEDNPQSVERFGKIPTLGNISHRRWLEPADDRAFDAILQEIPGLPDIAARLRS